MKKKYIAVLPSEWMCNELVNISCEASYEDVTTTASPSTCCRYLNIQWCISQMQQNFIMFIIVLGQHVSIYIDHLLALLRYRSLAMFKACCGIPNAYILDITMYKMHVSLCSYCTIRILLSKTLTGTYEGGYTYVFEISRIWRRLHIHIWDLKYIRLTSFVCTS